MENNPISALTFLDFPTIDGSFIDLFLRSGLFVGLNRQFLCILPASLRYLVTRYATPAARQQFAEDVMNILPPMESVEYQ